MGVFAKSMDDITLTVAVLIRSKGGILLCKTQKDPHLYSLPQGTVAFGETLEVAAQRIVEKEIGVLPTVVAQYHAYSRINYDEGEHTVLIVFLAELSSAWKLNDALPVICVPVDELPKYPTAQKQVLLDYANETYPQMM